MEVAVIYIFLWFVCFPKSFGRHMRTIRDAMNEPPK